MRRCYVIPGTRSLRSQCGPYGSVALGLPSHQRELDPVWKTVFSKIILICTMTFLKIASEADFTVLPEPKLSCSPVALRHSTRSQIESYKQDSLQINMTFLEHCTEFSCHDYAIFQWTTDYNIACVLFLKQLCLNILVLQFNFPSESTAVFFYQQIHSRMFLLATITKTFFFPSGSLGGI